MSLTSDLNAIKTVQDGVKDNKVTRFAYTANAYANNDVDGHSDYVATRENNIPLSDLSVIEVNQTVVDKGFRARASALNRMFLNHLFGRVSYNLNKINDLFNDLLAKIVANLGTPNGLATLDANGRIPYTQLPEDAMEYQGDWNAQTNTPTLADGTGTKGDTYFVSVGGTQDLGSGNITFFARDRVIYNGSVWQRLSSGEVQSVCEILPDADTLNVDLSKQGNVTKILPAPFLTKLSGGVFWSPLKGVNAQVYGVAYGNNIFVASSGLNMFYSYDGMNWTQTTVPNSPTGMYDIFFAGGLFITTGYFSGTYYPIWSEDGINWNVSNGLALTKGAEDIAYAGDSASSTYKWVLCTQGKVYCSTNGKTWEACTGIVNNGKATGACYGNGIWVCFSSTDSGGGFYSSENGKAWTLRYSVHAGLRFVNFAYAQGIFVSCTGSWSTDGLTWNNPESGSAGDSNNARIVYLNGAFYVDKARSVDGKNWINYTPSTEYFNSIGYGDGVFVGVPSNVGNVYRSTDGLSWYPVLGNKVGGQSRKPVIYAKGVFVVPSRNTSPASPSYSSVKDFIPQE